MTADSSDDDQTPDDQAPDNQAPDDQTLLIEEGDRLAGDLARRWSTPDGQHDRLQLIGRTLAVNLVRVFMETVQDVTRRVGRPLQTMIVQDALGRPEIVIVTADGEVRERIPVDDLLNRAFYSGSGLRPVVETHLRSALEAGNENLAVRARVACLKSRPVVDVSRPYLTRYTR